MYKKMFVILHSLELITPDVFLAEIWMKLYRFDIFLVNRIFVMSCQNILTPSDRFLDIFFQISAIHNYCQSRIFLEKTFFYIYFILGNTKRKFSTIFLFV